jgi:hypothetical protein
MRFKSRTEGWSFAYQSWVNSDNDRSMKLYVAGIERELLKVAVQLVMLYFAFRQRPFEGLNGFPRNRVALEINPF